MNLSVGFLTLGCKVNQYETDCMKELFQEKGIRVSENLNDKCDFYVVNTCSVTNMSDSKSRQLISKVNKINPNAVIAVVGCYSQISPEVIKNMKNVYVVLGNKYKSNIVDYCIKAYEKGIVTDKVEPIIENNDYEELKLKKHGDKTRAFIKIQDGCTQFCNYCIIPYTRGPLKSRDIKDIKEEILNLVEQGYKEIVFTGIHVTSYGRDLKNEIKLIDVIEEMSEIKKLRRIRLSSLEPNHINDDFVKRCFNTGKVCAHFHLSLQSGCDKILNLMNRKYNTETYMEKVDIIRNYYSDAGITTDIIVGFPGETEEDFQKTCEFAKKVKFSKIHIFKFSERSGTKAVNMDGKIDEKIKKDRSKILEKISNKLTEDFLENQKRKKMEVLFEEKVDENSMVGYSTNYCKVICRYRKEMIHDIFNVNILKSDGKNLFGILTE